MHPKAFRSMPGNDYLVFSARRLGMNWRSFGILLTAANLMPAVEFSATVVWKPFGNAIPARLSSGVGNLRSVSWVSGGTGNFSAAA